MCRQWFPLAACVLLAAACDPYQRFVGETSAGAVDPRNFPAAYLGVNPDGSPPDPTMPGSAVMLARTARVDGTEVGYYAFPYTGADDQSITSAGDLTVPIAYDFDDDPNAAKCIAPKNYLYDQQRDDVRYDEQGNVFVQLPDADGYQPIVADVAVTPNGLPCQDTKEETNLVARTDVTFDKLPAKDPTLPDAHVTGKPSGTYFAHAIIDPSIDVRGPIGYYGADDPGGSTDPNTDLGPQKWGWYQRYLVAYIDGGAIPSMDSMVTDSTGKPQRVTSLLAQNLYYPTQHAGLNGEGNRVPVPGAPGDGYDVLDKARGTDGYSPLCELFSFNPADALNPETSVADIDMSTTTPMGFVWCLQVAK